MKKNDELLAMLHSELASALLEKIKSGEAKPGDFKEAREFLKDNNINSIPKVGTPLHNLADIDIPFDVQMS